MNRDQKIAVAIGVALVVLSGLFPPYEGRRPTSTGYIPRHIGHHFLFAPPTSEYVYKAFNGKNASTPFGSTSFYSASVVLSEVVLQLSVIVLATAGVTLLLAKRKT